MRAEQTKEIHEAAERIKTGMLTGKVKYENVNFYTDILKIISLTEKKNKNVSKKEG